MGLLLGVPLVSREIEHRTAAIAWTMSRSRTWWLARRVLFLALVMVVLLGVVAVVGEVLASATLPAQHLDRDFAWYGRRGALIVVRGLASLGIGVLVGAWIGRVLPALLVARLSHRPWSSAASASEWTDGSREMPSSRSSTQIEPAGARLASAFCCPMAS